MDVDDDRSVKPAWVSLTSTPGGCVGHRRGMGTVGFSRGHCHPAGEAQLETNFWGTVRVVRESYPACAVVVADGSF